MKEILAKVCAFCPVCNFVRKNPNSKFADFWIKLEKLCPFCRAYYSINPRAGEK